MDPQFEVCQKNLEILEQETDAKGRRLQVIKVRRGRMQVQHVAHFLPRPRYTSGLVADMHRPHAWRQQVAVWAGTCYCLASNELRRASTT